jgi:hypothetical protein
MTKKVIKREKQFREEWTKYYVNDIECTRDTIYQAILDNKLKNEIKIRKKYHFKSSETKKLVINGKSEEHGVRKSIFGPVTFHRISKSCQKNTSNKSNTDDLNARFSFDFSKFFENFTSNSREFKLLIHRQINIVDLFFSTMTNYKKHAEDLTCALTIFLKMIFGAAGNPDARYNDIVYKACLEHLILLFDMLAFILSVKIDANLDRENLPKMDLDLSDIKETWSDSWTESHKSEYLEKYLSVLFKQADVLHQSLNKDESFASNQYLRGMLDGKFNHFKNLIQMLQAKKHAYDNATEVSASVFSTYPSLFSNTLNRLTEPASSLSSAAILRPGSS